jgi:hypothetical protein
LFTITVSVCVEPQVGSADTFTENVPRLPAPFLAVTEIVLEPLPSILTSDSPITKLFPLPSCTAPMVRAPGPPAAIVKIAVPVFCVESLWLIIIVLGLIDATH